MTRSKAILLLPYFRRVRAFADFHGVAAFGHVDPRSRALMMPVRMWRTDEPSITGLGAWTTHGTLLVVCDPAFEEAEDGTLEFSEKSFQVLEFPASALLELSWVYGLETDGSRVA